MRVRGFLAGAAMLLIGAQSCCGMGSGPHPNVPIPYGIGHQQTPVAPEGLMLVGCLAVLGVLTWALRVRRSSP